MESHEGSARDFDFWIGSWRIRNRRLKERLAGCTEWDDFEATATARPLPGGIGNLDEFRTDFWPGFVGMSYRFYDPASRAWSIHWIDSRLRALQPPVTGAFDGEVGVFEGDDTLAGRPIRVRFTWIRGASPRWEQAFSPDDGRTWETNWTMEMSRVRSPAPSRLEVVELRRYLVAPGRRDLFARRFDTVVPDVFDQLRAPILGQFTVRGVADGFTWLRGFESYDDAAPAKAAYYDGPHWALHHARTNALIADSDDSLLLRPLEPIVSPPPADPEVDAPRGGVAMAIVATLRDGTLGRADAAFLEWRERLRAAGARELAVLGTLDRPNPFPRHPVRTDGPHLAWLGVTADDAGVERLRLVIESAGAALAGAGLLRAPLEVTVLDPTPRSRWR
jgi:hypothetical protein